VALPLQQLTDDDSVATSLGQNQNALFHDAYNAGTGSTAISGVAPR
jgi:hypothetical protein